jgi:hypothetical protein
MMSRGVEPILVTRLENVVLPRAKPIMAEYVSMAIRVKYSEPSM